MSLTGVFDVDGIALKLVILCDRISLADVIVEEVESVERRYAHKGQGVVVDQCSGFVVGT